MSTDESDNFVHNTGEYSWIWWWQTVPKFFREILIRNKKGCKPWFIKYGISESLPSLFPFSWKFLRWNHFSKNQRPQLKICDWRMFRKRFSNIENSVSWNLRERNLCVLQKSDSRIDLDSPGWWQKMTYWVTHNLSKTVKRSRDRAFP
jgi:hypothetical protein